MGVGRGGCTNGILLTCTCKPFAVRANSSTGSVGRGHVWFPLVHVHVVQGCPEIVRAANSICSERVSTCSIVEDDPGLIWAGGSVDSAGWWLCMASVGYAGLLSGLAM